MTDNRFKFTVSRLAAVPVPEHPKRTYVYDTEVPGLAFCRTANNATAFYLYKRIGGRPERIRLGSGDELSIERARTAAGVKLGQIAQGINPQDEKRAARGAATIGALFVHYLTTHAKPHNRSWREDVEQFCRYFGRPAELADADYREPKGKDKSPAPFASWRTRSARSATVEDVKALHAKLGKNHGHYAANRVLALLSSMFNNAHLPNPTKGVRRFKEHKRERFLQADELPRFFAALETEPHARFRDFFKITLLTGARRGNVQAMAWADVNLERATWTIPAAQAKGGDAVHIPLAPEAVAILADRLSKRRGENPWVFPSRGGTGHLVEPKLAWKELLAQAKIPDLRIHDLRRTLGSWQAALGASLPIIGKSLGHADGSPATAIYARLNIDPVRQSVNAATAAIVAASKLRQPAAR